MRFDIYHLDYESKIYKTEWYYLDKYRTIGSETKNLIISVNKIIKEIDNIVVVRFVEYENIKSSFMRIYNYIDDFIFSKKKIKNFYLKQEI